MTPITYLLKLRIDQSKRAARERPDLSIEQVSASVGLTDPLYFSRQFKRLVGRSLQGTARISSHHPHFLNDIVCPIYLNEKERLSGLSSILRRSIHALVSMLCVQHAILSGNHYPSAEEAFSVFRIASMRSSSSFENSRLFKATTLSSIWLTLLAPIRADVTRPPRRTQARASGRDSDSALERFGSKL